MKQLNANKIVRNLKRKMDFLLFLGTTTTEKLLF